MSRALLIAVVVTALAAGGARGAPAKGEGPTTIAAAYGSVWVGTGDGTVVRLDARTGRVQARLLREKLVQYGFVHALAAGFGSLWVGDEWELDRIDPRTNRVRSVEGVAWAPSAVAVGGRVLWVADHARNTVFRLDPRRARVVARIRPAQARVLGLAAGPTGVWVAVSPGLGPIEPGGPREIRAIDIERNRVGPAIARSRCDFALAAGSSAVWVSDLCAKTVTRIADARLGRPIPVGGAAVALAVAYGSVWVLSQEDGTVSRLDARSQRVVASIPARGVSLAGGARAVWVLDPGDGLVGYVRRIDPQTNRVAGAPIRIGPS